MEYKVVQLTKLVGDGHDLDGITAGLEKSLGELGAGGWELTLVTHDAVVLKRPQ